MTMTARLRTALDALPTWLTASVVTLATLAPPLVAADDTEVFFTRPAESGSRSANVLFMFDTSGSMNEKDGGDTKRIDRVKQAMLDVLDGADDVNVGIGAFNGLYQGGAILYPTADLTTDVCPNGSCDAIRHVAAVVDIGDDAAQYPDGSMDLTADRLHLVDYVDPATITTTVVQPLAGNDDAVQVDDGTFVLDDDKIALFFRSQAGTPVSARAGVRFPAVPIPQGAHVVSAQVVFSNSTWNANGDVRALIELDGADDSLDFADSLGQRVADRVPLATSIAWDNIPARWTENHTFLSPDLAPLLNERIARTDWSAGEALTLLFSDPVGVLPGWSDYRSFKTFESGVPPRLEIRWTAAAPTYVSGRAGLRFAGIDVPRGATVTSAVLEFASAGDDSSPAALVIEGEAVGNAPAYEATDWHLSGRAGTAASVAWDAEPWQTTPLRADKGGRYDAELLYRTPDLTAVVQEIVDRADWCGGNALALQISGSGHRVAWTRDDSAWTAPRLRIAYDPASVDAATTCVSQSIRVPVARANDDATESLSTSDVALGDTTLSTGSGNAAVIGLRFDDIELPANATITAARLSLGSAGSVAGAYDMTIAGHRIGYAPNYVSGSGANLSNRPETATLVAWNDVPELPAGARLRSPDIAAVIQDIADRPAWAPGNALALKLRYAGGTGERLFQAFDADPAAAAVLSIDYRLEGAALGGSVPTLRTARDEMRELLLDFQARGGTPIVDSYFEAASYMLGEPVDFGLQRGRQEPIDRFFRTSAESSWSGGSLYRPPGCSEVDANAVACVDEAVSAGARYDAPLAGACQVNQIVLLSDGDARQNSSRDRIRSLTGAPSCDARANTHEECGLELARWLDGLDGGDGGRDRILTHTIGFNFSSPFLTELAAAGGGRFETADSAASLANVFKTIINEAAELNTTFVSPAASISRFNRLTNSDDVYYAMFKPDTSLRWDGNLKRYELGTDTATGETTIVDKLGRPIFDDVDGGIRADAESWWVDALPGPDGATVAAGGAANQMPASRDVRTFVRDALGIPGPLVPLHEDTALLDTAALGITGADAGYRQELLRWARGVDVRDADGDGDTSETRQQMGDPMHSTPFVLHYDDGTNTVSNVFVGTNEGYLHAIDTETGAERWAIVPNALLGNLARFMENGTGERPYGLDGAITGWIDDVDGDLVVDTGERATIVVGMRRGGRDYYAFDVSDPDAPALAWTIRGGSGDFAELGQSWSAPVKARIAVGGTPTDVLLFGGGYDPGHDERTERDPLADTMGRAMFIVNAATGALIDELDGTDFLAMDHAVAADLNVIDMDLDGLADLVFAADLGGQIWRFDIDNDAPASERNSAGIALDGGVIADLSGGGESGNRRFFQRPDVALLQDEDGGAVLNLAIGSGWRAHPLDDVVEDRFYAIRQTSVFGPPRDGDGAIDYTTVRESDLFNATSASGRTDTTARIDAGWYIALGEPGEKVLANSLTLDGTVLFTTYLPDASGVDECSVSVGGGRLYKVDARYADPVQNLAEEADDAEPVVNLEDRWRLLNVRGIPSAPQVYVGDVDPDAPIVATGDGTEDSGLGAGTRRTYWVEN